MWPAPYWASSLMPKLGHHIKMLQPYCNNSSAGSRWTLDILSDSDLMVSGLRNEMHVAASHRWPSLSPTSLESNRIHNDETQLGYLEARILSWVAESSVSFALMPSIQQNSFALVLRQLRISHQQFAKPALSSQLWVPR